MLVQEVSGEQANLSFSGLESDKPYKQNLDQNYKPELTYEERPHNVGQDCIVFNLNYKSEPKTKLLGNR